MRSALCLVLARSISLVGQILAACAACAACAEGADAPPGDPDALATAWARDRATLAAAMKPAEVPAWTPADHAPLIEIDAKIDPATSTITGVQRTWIAGPAGGTPTVALRCPANGASFHGAGIAIRKARWNGAVLPPVKSSADGTGFTWTLPAPLAAGASGCLGCEFATKPSEKGYHGLMGKSGGRWCLYHWHPELPAWRDGNWFLPPVTGIGDESQTPLAPVLLHLTVPADTQVICAGIVARAPAGPGWDTLTISAPTCRNLALEVVTGTEEHLTGGMLTVDGVQVRSWAESFDAQGAARALAVAVASVTVYERDFGSYPLNGLDVVESAQGDGVGGMESSGLVFIDSGPYGAVYGLTPAAGIDNLGLLIFTIAVAHEVGHQWWYGLVGSDAFADPWLDESLTNSSEDLVVEEMYGAKGRKAARKYHEIEAMWRPGALAEAIDRPLTAYVDTGNDDYGGVVYGRGALMYIALRERLGDDRYFAWLRQWLAAHRYGVATPAQWHAHLAEILGAHGEQAFSDLWMEGHGMTQAVVDAVVSGNGGGGSATAAAPADPAPSASEAQAAP